MKARTIFTLTLITLLLVPTVGAAYILRNNGTITIDHGSLYIDGDTVDQYIIGLVGVGGGNFDQSLNTTDDVEFNSLTLGGIQQFSWPNGTVQSVDWIITGDGTTYTATHHDGTSFSGTTFSTIANWVMGNLTSNLPRETVYFKGDFNLNTASIKVPDYCILDGYGAYIELTGNIDAVFESYNLGASRSDFVIIRGFVLDGNKATRNSGSGIKGSFFFSDFYDNVIREFYEYGIDLHSYTSSVRAVAKIHHNYIGGASTGQANKAGGVRIGHNGYATADCIITENFFINNGNWQIIIEQGATHRIGYNHFAAWADAGDTQCGGIYIGQIGGGTTGDVDNVQIYTNHFEQNYREAIYINAQAGAFIDSIDISGNNFYAIGRGVNNTYPVIHVHSNGGSTRFGKITDNTASSNQVTMKANYFIYLHGANSDYWLIDSNSIQITGGGAAAWDDLLDESGGTTTLGDNIGIS